jgi:hypothetical protein
MIKLIFPKSKCPSDIFKESNFFFKNSTTLTLVTEYIIYIAQLSEYNLDFLMTSSNIKL